MYYDYFGLNQPPFKITPDTSLFFPGGNRGAILEALVYAVLNGEGIVKVVGEVGSGKTMLCRMLEVELPDNVEIVYLANPSLSPDHILHAIAFELALDVDANDERLKVMNKLQKYLLDRHASNRQVVVFVEEAQSMPIATLEEIRLLSNLETQTHKLLQIVLFGQPELDQMIAKREIRQLKERITYSFNLTPLKSGEIKDYLNSRLRACGYRAGSIFSASAIREIANYSDGLLRRINILADKSLLSAYANNKQTVSAKHVKMAARDSEFFTGGLPYRYAIYTLCLLLSVLLLLWLLPLEKVKQELERLMPAAVTAISTDGEDVPAPQGTTGTLSEEVAAAVSSANTRDTLPAGEAEIETVYHTQDFSRYYEYRNPGSGELFDPDRPDYGYSVEDKGLIGITALESTVQSLSEQANRQVLSEPSSSTNDSHIEAQNHPTWQSKLSNSQLTRSEADFLVNQLEKLPPEAGNLASTGEKCRLCTSIIYRPLKVQENP